MNSISPAQDETPMVIIPDSEEGLDDLVNPVNDIPAFVDVPVPDPHTELESYLSPIELGGWQDFVKTGYASGYYKAECFNVHGKLVVTEDWVCENKTPDAAEPDYEWKLSKVKIDLSTLEVEYEELFPGFTQPKKSTKRFIDIVDDYNNPIHIDVPGGGQIFISAFTRDGIDKTIEKDFKKEVEYFAFDRNSVIYPDTVKGINIVLKGTETNIFWKIWTANNKWTADQSETSLKYNGEEVKNISKLEVTKIDGKTVGMENTTTKQLWRLSLPESEWDWLDFSEYDSYYEKNENGTKTLELWYIENFWHDTVFFVNEEGERRFFKRGDFGENQHLEIEYYYTVLMRIIGYQARIPKLPE